MEKRNHKFLCVDPEKFTSEFAKRGLVKSAVSTELGYAHTYLNHVMGTGTIRKAVMDLLDSKYGIRYDDIKPDEPVVEEPVEEEPEVALESGIVLDEAFWDKLSLVLYASVFKAVKDALDS